VYSSSSAHDRNSGGTISYTLTRSCLLQHPIKPVHGTSLLRFISFSEPFQYRLPHASVGSFPERGQIASLASPGGASN